MRPRLWILISLWPPLRWLARSLIQLTLRLTRTGVALCGVTEGHVRRPKENKFPLRKVPKLIILKLFMSKILLESCYQVSNAYLYQISGHLIVIPGYRSQKCPFLVKNWPKIAKISILLHCTPKVLLNLYEGIIKAHLCQISAHSVAIPRYRSQKCPFLVKNWSKNRKNKHFVVLYTKSVIEFIWGHYQGTSLSNFSSFGCNTRVQGPKYTVLV